MEATPGGAKPELAAANAASIADGNAIALEFTENEAAPEAPLLRVFESVAVAIAAA